MEQFISLEEQETTVNFSRTMEEVDIWTSDRTVMTRLDKLCETSPEFYKLTATNYSESGKLLSREYEISDKSMLSFRSVKRNQNMTEEQKRELAERLKGSK